jgi:hypothetical protein
MEKLIRNVLDKYNTGRKSITNMELARLIVAHIKVGIDGKKGWYLNLNTYDDQNVHAQAIIDEYK